jgi:FlaA1/EpsC-like NDP-sugar epimerase
MEKKRYTPTQIVGMLREAESLLDTGRTVGEVGRHVKVVEATYYWWRAEYTGIPVDQVTRLKELEEENRRLKTVVADQALDISILREVARGNY